MNKDDEQILVIKSSILFKEEKWQGLKKNNLDYYINLIKNNFEFKRRGDVENDNSYQQIIPYIIFNYQDKYFLYRYLKKAGEQRLLNDYIVGIGGHINKDDVKENEDILEAGRDREWDEEVEYDGQIDKKLVGILNDDRRAVESVHLGLVYLFKGNTPNIRVKEIDKMIGGLCSLEEFAEKTLNTEGWATIIYDEYIKLIN